MPDRPKFEAPDGDDDGKTFVYDQTTNQFDLATPAADGGGAGGVVQYDDPGGDPVDVSAATPLPVTIGATEVVSVDDNGASLTVDGTVAVSGGTVTTITNVVHVDDNAGTLTVDGTVTANAGTGPWPVTDNGGTLSIDDGGGTVTVDGTVAATQSGTWNVGTVTPGGGAANLGKAEDAAHTDGDTGVFMLAVRQSEANSLTSTAGADGDYTALNSDARGLLQVVARPYVSRIRVASSGLTTVTTTYTIGDTAGAIMTFANAARVSGGTGTILSATLLDKGDVGTDYRLHIYRVSVTLAADNVAWAVSDSDQESLIGIVTMPSMIDVGANRVSTLANIGLPYDCNATSLFVGVETRTANAVYAAATDLNLILTVALD